MELEFHFGGYSATHFGVFYKEGVLQCYKSEYPCPPTPELLITVIPDVESWNLLYIFLAGCKWKQEYLADICDGIQWKLLVKDKGINIETYGSNAYPTNFNYFLKLLNGVIATSGVVVPFN